MTTMFTNNPYTPKSKYPIRLPSIIDVIKESLQTVKNVELKEDQTPLFWSLSHVLTELPLIGDRIIETHGYSHSAHTNLFVSPTGEIPRISIPDYLVRLVKFSPCSKECFIMIIVYIDRMISKGNFIVNSFNIHRLLITCIMVASKYIDDIFYNNEYYSHIGGVTRDELNKLEIAFLTILEFDTSCPLPDYLDYFSHLDSFVSHIRQIRQKTILPPPATLAVSVSPIQASSHHRTTNIICNTNSTPSASTSITSITNNDTRKEIASVAAISNNATNNNTITNNIPSNPTTSSTSGSRRKSIIREQPFMPATIISN